jgi:hypothetical protein
MSNRWYPLAVLACWAAAMTWLVVEKVLPTLREGDRPDYDAVLPAEAEAPRPQRWEIYYRDRPIGTATSLSIRNDDNSGRLESEVKFSRLPLSEIVTELFGNLATLVKPLWRSGERIEVELTVDSQMHIGADGNLRSFVTHVRMAQWDELIQVRGEVQQNQLNVAVLTPAGENESDGEMVERYRDQMNLPSEAMVSGALSPQSRLAGLYVGQTWNLPVYRPFPPNQPLQMVQARVESEELFVWQGEAVRAFQVVFRDEAGSGISVTREPIGRMWVRADGTVLEQEARIANLQFRFVRLPDGERGASAP